MPLSDDKVCNTSDNGEISGHLMENGSLWTMLLRISKSLLKGSNRATSYLLTLFLVSQPTHKDFEFQIKVDFSESRISKNSNV